uniref:Ovule protein n=1 Tax=Panagrellus redivivus TaxID=6233 RepID=A0A7E4UVU3_PANRE
MFITSLKQHLVIDLANSIFFLPSRLHPNPSGPGLVRKDWSLRCQSRHCPEHLYRFPVKLFECTHDENEFHINPLTLRLGFIKYSRTLMADSMI